MYFTKNLSYGIVTLHYHTSQTTTLALIAVVAASGLLGIVVIESIFVGQDQAVDRGCPLEGNASNASRGTVSILRYLQCPLF
jgi:uncharacterized membrane protein YjgN (DUF898 family)